MSKAVDDSETVRWWPWLIGVIVVYIGYWYIIWISGWFSELEKGKFGDTFGALNALFAGLAFAGVIYAILLQQRELKLQREELELQRKELEDTRVEIRGQKEQLAAQNQTLQHQNFESSFFQLLTMHSEIVNSMKTPSDKPSGRECFLFLLISLQNTLEIAIDRNLPQTEVFNATYEEEFLSQFQPYVGHYFQHLYNIVKFVHEHEFFDEKEFKEKKRYTNFIRAQLSSNELGLLFYHGLSDRGAKFKDLVEEYALFEDLSPKVLIDEEHRKFYAPSAYGKSD